MGSFARLLYGTLVEPVRKRQRARRVVDDGSDDDDTALAPPTSQQAGTGIVASSPGDPQVTSPNSQDVQGECATEAMDIAPISSQAAVDAPATAATNSTATSNAVSTSTTTTTTATTTSATVAMDVEKPADAGAEVTTPKETDAAPATKKLSTGKVGKKKVCLQ